LIKKINEFEPKGSERFTIGLPTGSSPLEVYKYLVKAYKDGRVSFKNVVTFNMDEYVGIAENNLGSYHHYMHSNLFDHIDIPKENINILNGNNTDIKAECAAYEEKIKSVGGIRVFLGGIGVEGHIAFNEKGSTPDSITREITLQESTIQRNSKYFSSPEEIPKTALTVGISTILNADEVIILAFGKEKANAVKESLRGEVGPECPGSFIRTHKSSQFICDTEAASLL
jgi:glucosamine-6-phosphate deaminase